MEETIDDLRIYICIDLKSYYASVECVERHVDPLKANLLVADPDRSDKTICLAVSPALKAIGVPGRPRLFEAKEAIRKYEIEHHTRVYYYIAPPRMARYIEVSSDIYAIYLKYAAAEDIHVYSIDECFIDATPYLHLYPPTSEEEAEADEAGFILQGVRVGESSRIRAALAAAHRMAITMIRDVLKTTGITATAGVGTNMYLAKVAMDIVAKKQKADADGVRIARLDENAYKVLLWGHLPLTDFWQIGGGTARRLFKYGIYTMGDIARVSWEDEALLYKNFGIDAELLIDHAWGMEPCTMEDIKRYRSVGHSLNVGQVLARPYKFKEAELVFKEMIDNMCAGLLKKKLITDNLGFWVSFDPESVTNGTYTGPCAVDFYGREHPPHAGGTVRLYTKTNSCEVITGALVGAFRRKVDPDLLIRRLGVTAVTKPDSDYVQMDLFTDYDRINKEKQIRSAMLEIRKRYGRNAVLKGMNLLEGGTAKERNTQIGGHRA